MAASSELADRQPLPWSSLGERMQRRKEQIWLLVDVLIVAWLCWLFDAINNTAPVRQELAVLNGRRLLDVEQALRLDPERALDRWLSHDRALSVIVVFWYENVHIIVTLGVLAWLWWRRPDVLGVMRATLVIVNVVALAAFWTVPVAPPRMISTGYVDLVARTEHLPVWQIGDTALHSNQLCSLPSLHIAWATWCSIAVWQMTQRRWLRAIAIVYPLLTTLAVMATGNHYLADAVAGAGLTALAFLVLSRPALARRLDASRQARNAREQPA